MISFCLRKKNKIVKRKKTGAKKHKQTTYLWVAFSACFLLFVSISLGFYWILNSDFLKIKSIRITGCNRTNKNSLLKQTGIKTGDNILTLDLRKKSRNLETDPWIYNAVVKRKLPDTIEIEIEEREPLAVIELDSFYLVDRNGDIFKKTWDQEQNLPLLTGLVREDIIKNSNESSKVIDAAVTLIDSLLKTKMLRGSDTTIKMNKDFGLSFVNSRDPITVSMGFNTYDKKLVLLDRIMNDLAEKGLSAKAVNLRSVEKAYVMLNRGVI